MKKTLDLKWHPPPQKIYLTECGSSFHILHTSILLQFMRIQDLGRGMGHSLSVKIWTGGRVKQSNWLKKLPYVVNQNAPISSWYFTLIENVSHIRKIPVVFTLWFNLIDFIVRELKLECDRYISNIDNERNLYSQMRSTQFAVTHPNTGLFVFPWFNF